MDPGVRSHGMKADPLGYLWCKYEFFLMSGWWDIPHLSCFNVKLWSNSKNGIKLRTDWRTGRRKLYTPRHKCRGYKNPWTIKCRSQWPTFILRSNVLSYWLIILKYDGNTLNSLRDIRQNHWIMKYRSQWRTFIFRSNVMSYRLIISKYGVSNRLKDIWQNHWTMKYRSPWPTLRTNVESYRLIILNYDVHTSVFKIQGKITGPWNIGQWPTFIFVSNIRSYWLIIPKYDVHTPNSLQDIRQNHWTMKYTSWPIFILRWDIGSYWLIIPKYDVHTSNSLQDIRQNHRTIKYRSQWPTFIFKS